MALEQVQALLRGISSCTNELALIAIAVASAQVHSQCANCCCHLGAAGERGSAVGEQRDHKIASRAISDAMQGQLSEKLQRAEQEKRAWRRA